MTSTQWIAAFALPLVGALHFYAVSYGFRGESKKLAFAKATRAAFMLTLLVAAYVVWSYSNG